MSLWLPFFPPQSPGNEQAAADLYGIGVRIGLYLQSCAFVLNIVQRDNRQSQALPASILMISIYSGWACLARAKNISPAETLIIYNLIGAVQFPALAAVLYSKMDNDATALLLVVGTSVVLRITDVWFWAKGYNTLPLLDTNNQAFFFARVSIDESWFRNFSLACSCIQLLVIVFFTVPFGVKRWFTLVRSYWATGNARVDSPIIQINKKSIITRNSANLQALEDRIAMILVLGMYIFVAVFYVAGTEFTISWNELPAARAINTPGQLIPLVSGIVSFVDATFTLCRWIIFRRRPLDAPKGEKAVLSIHDEENDSNFTEEVIDNT